MSRSMQSSSAYIQLSQHTWLYPTMS
jgi:hypothetical protein